MEEQLIEFSTAKLAKEKGFDIETLHFYIKPNSKIFGIDEKGRSYPIKNVSKKVYRCGGYAVLNIENVIPAPTQSLLQRWLREVHQINVESNYLPNIEKYGCLYIPMSGKAKLSDIKFVSKKYFNTYEEALEIGLQEALKLIPDGK